MTVDDTPKGTVDGDGPVETEDRLANILEDPETDTDEDEVQADDTSDDIEDDGDEADEDDEGEEPEDSDEDDAGDDDDGPDAEIKGGRIAPRNAKVKLDDGTLTTVEDLLKGTLRQSDYSRKTQDLAREREELKAEVERHNQASQELAQQRKLAEAMLESWRPRPPENPREDPIAWMEYQQGQEAWNHWYGQLQEQNKRAEEAAEAERQEAERKRLEAEYAMLVQKAPAFNDAESRQRITNELVEHARKSLSYSDAALQAASNHHEIILTIMENRQLKARAAKAPEVKDRVSKKPKVMRGSKRGSDSKGSAKRAAMDRLRETGSARDAEAVLSYLDD